MMSLKISFVFLVVVVVTLVAGDGFNTEKCKHPAEFMETFKKCYKEETGEEFTDPNYTIEDIDKKGHEKVGMCFAKEFGLLTADGASVDLDKVNAAMDKYEADATVKDALKKGAQACKDKGGDAAAFMKCNRQNIATNCN